MSPVYEVVTGTVLLAQRKRFYSLHEEILLPMMRNIGIEPILMLITEIGTYGRFLDVYRYENLAKYEELTDALIGLPALDDYYKSVGECILGTIAVEIMQELPYANGWVKA